MSSMVSSHFTDIICPEVGRGQNVEQRFLPYFDFVAAGGIRVSQHTFLVNLENFQKQKTNYIIIPFFSRHDIAYKCYHCEFKDND